MSETAQPEKKAWQPLTPEGVARFAVARFTRLLVVQCIVAIAIAALGIWILNTRYAPVIEQAIQQLPENARIEKGELHGLSPGVLAERKFVSVVVEGEAGSTSIADFEIRLTRSDLKICSVLGCFEIAYPKHYIISLSRTELEPRWGAWKPFLLMGTGVFIFFALLVSWWLLALLYAAIPKLISFYADRQLTWPGSWRLVGAGQIPGALFAALIFWLYALQTLDLIRVMFFYSIHFVIPWIYIFWAPRYLARTREAPAEGNPFIPPAS